jgi:hypothetical protein
VFEDTRGAVMKEDSVRFRANKGRPGLIVLLSSFRSKERNVKEWHGALSSLCSLVVNFEHCGVVAALK